MCNQSMIDIVDNKKRNVNVYTQIYKLMKIDK